MKKLYSKIGRIFLYIFAAVGFVLIGTLLLFYSLGYRYDFSSGKPYKIGILTVTTKPDGATVYLDGKAEKKSTPVDLRNLLPKQYTIKIEREGYQTFEGKINVEAGMVSRIEDLLLISSDLKPEDLEIKSTQSLASNDLRRIAYVSSEVENSGIWFYDTSAKTHTKLFPLQQNLPVDSKFTIYAWSPSGKMLLFHTENSSPFFWLVSADNPQEIRKINLPLPTKVIWNADEPYFLNPDGQLANQTGDAQEAVSGILDATFFNGRFYFFKKYDEKLVLEKRSDLKEKAEEIIQLASDSSPKFYPENSQILFIHYSDGKISWLKTEGMPTLIPIAAKANLAIYNSNFLVIWNGLEFSFSEYPFEETNLITKIQDLKLNSISFYDKYCFLVQENNEIKIRSIFSENGTSLAQIKSGKSLGIKEKTLFFENEGKIFSLELQPK